jgi:bifunctional pyridoxal-dependent enzyme with beta-cystathionase and maltose regulon repressor activities
MNYWLTRQLRNRVQWQTIKQDLVPMKVLDFSVQQKSVAEPALSPGPQPKFGLTLGPAD